MLGTVIELGTAFGTYRCLEILGEGATSQVYGAIDETGKECAVKVLRSTQLNGDRRKRFKNEFLFGQRNQHPHILSILDHGVLAEGDQSRPFFIMPKYQSSLRPIIQTGITDGFGTADVFANARWGRGSTSAESHSS
jgi:serine/threonine protein kinase